MPRRTGRRWCSAAEWRKHNRENSSPPCSLENQLALMLPNDPIGHEEAEPGPTLLGREVRLEEGGPLVVGHSGTIIDHAEVGPAVAAPAGLELDVTFGRCCIDGVVDEIGDHLPQK